MKRLMLTILTLALLMTAPNKGLADELPLNLGPQELVQANGVDIQVPGYSVPSFADWNNDNLNDLVIGEGGGYGDAKVRVYLNVGTELHPQFADFFYAQTYGWDLTVPASGCMGCFPRLVQWNSEVDNRKDLLVGRADGTITIFTNIATDSNAVFDEGKLVWAGTDQVTIDVGARATPSLVDWDNDGKQDLVVGSIDGSIRVFINCSCSAQGIPTFNYSEPTGLFVQEDGANLVVPGGRSSPVILDLDHDGKKDLLTGNTEGQLLFYKNVGTDANPTFSGYSLIESAGTAIDLPDAPRSRPFVGYWTGDGHFGPIDGYPDVLIGAGDGKIHLHRGIPMRGDLDLDGDVDFEDFAVFADHWYQPNSRSQSQSGE